MMIDEQMLRGASTGPMYAEFLADMVLRFGVRPVLRDMEAVLERRLVAVDIEIADVRRKQQEVTT